MEEPLDEEERELMDPESWDWDSTVEVIPNPNVAIGCEVPFVGDATGPLDEEGHGLMDPEIRDSDSSSEAVVYLNSGAILLLRFTREEAVSLQRQAHTEGITTHEYIKQAALARLPQDVSSR